MYVLVDNIVFFKSKATWWRKKQQKHTIDFYGIAIARTAKALNTKKRWVALWYKKSGHHWPRKEKKP